MRLRPLVLALTLAAPLGAQAPDSAALRRATACLADTLGLTPHWRLTLRFVDDSTAAFYGIAEANPFALQADITYNTLMIARRAQPIRDIALHEVLHVVLADLTQMAREGFDERIAAFESEKLVRAVVRWPLWGGLCAPKTR